MRDNEFPYVEFNSQEAQLVMLDRCTRCPLCGKVFYIRVVEDYVYKLNNNKNKQRILCSWTCYREAQKIRKNCLKYTDRHI